MCLRPVRRWKWRRTRSPSPDVLTEWTSWALIERNLAEGTVLAYSRELRSLAAHADPAQLPELEPDELRSWLHAHPGSPSSVSRRVSALRSYGGFAAAAAAPTTHLWTLIGRSYAAACPGR